MHDTHSLGNTFDLLLQLENILQSDTLIDEVGFVHPWQFVALNEGTDDSHPPSICTLPPKDEIVGADMPDLEVVQFNCSIFWNKDHKLAISTEALLPLYNAAMSAFMTVAKKYDTSSNLSTNDLFVDEKVGSSSSNSRTSLEDELMKHSKALLILSYDFGSAWNARKLVVSKKHDNSLFLDELQLSALVLSHHPKSESAWSHRRWVIKMIARKCQNLSEMVKKESELVEKIAEV